MIRSSTILTLAMCFIILCGYGIHAGLSRLWGPGPFGDYIVVMTILVWMEIIINSGVPTAVSKLIAEDGENESRILKTSLFLQMRTGACLLVILVLLSPLFGMMMGQQRMTFYLLVAAVDIPFMGLYALYHKALSGKHLFGRQAGTMATYAASRLLAILGLAALGFGIWGALAGNIIGSVAGGIAGFFLLGLRGSGKAYEREKISGTGRQTATYWLAFHLLIGLDLICIRVIMPDPATAGYYGAAMTLARIPYFVFVGLNIILVPLIARALTRGMREQASAYIRQAVTFLFIILFIGIALILSSSRDLVGLIYSAAFLPAAPALDLLIVAFSFLCFFMLMGSILIGAGRAKTATRMAFILLPLSLLLNLALIPPWGMIGAASATLTTACAGAVLALIVARKELPITLDSPRLVKALAAAAAVYLVSTRWQLSGGLLPLKYLILILAYFIILLVTQALSVQDVFTLLKKENERSRH